MNNTQLIKRAMTGDEAAFRTLVQLHKAKLTAMAFSYVKSFEEAQDAVQETYIQAFRSLPQLKEPAYFGTWLCKILIRRCLHTLKQQKRAADIKFELQ